MSSTIHESYMRWAIALALEGAGKTSPNPIVGAVIVKSRQIVGEGYHCFAGTPHAEIHALNKAGSKAKGADLYVTMEPCCTEGRTPPCVNAIIAAGIKRVFVGVKDPNPAINGRGIERLLDAGIKVEHGILESACRELNEAFSKYITSGTPYVTAKVALSLDGKIAAGDGGSKWISNAESRKYVQKLRTHSDAIIVGGGTIRRDNPRLTLRMKGWNGLHPKAVVVDSLLNIPMKSNVLKRRSGECIFATTKRASVRRRKRIEDLGHNVIICRSLKNDLVSLSHMLKMLGKMEITSVLLEGGGELFSAFMKSKLIDRVVVFIAPIFLGGNGLDFLPNLSISGMRNAIKIKGEVDIRRIGDNAIFEGKLN